MESIYENGSYHRHNPTWHLEDSPWKAQQILKMLKKHNLELETIGEIGCGAGGILKHLSQCLPGSIALHGFEISEAAYSLCKQWQVGNLHFHLEDLLEKPSVFFDLLLVIDVIEHVEDYFGFLRKLRGKAHHKIFHIPLDFNLINLLRPQILPNMRKNIGHIHYFSKETALASLEDTGYEVVDWFYTPCAFELASTTRKIAMFNLPRRILFVLRPDLSARIFGGFSIMVLAK